MDFFQVLPRGPGKALIRGGAFATAGRAARDAHRALAGQPHQPAGQREDGFLCGRLQRGLAAAATSPGRCRSIENCMFEFHDLLRERIPEVSCPSAPARFA